MKLLNHYESSSTVITSWLAGLDPLRFICCCSDKGSYESQGFVGDMIRTLIMKTAAKNMSFRLYTGHRHTKTYWYAEGKHHPSNHQGNERWYHLPLLRGRGLWQHCTNIRCVQTNGGEVLTDGERFHIYLAQDNSPIHNARIVRDWWHSLTGLQNHQTSIQLRTCGPMSAKGGLDMKADLGENCSPV